MILSTPVPYWLDKDAAQAVDMCPALALRAPQLEQPGGVSLCSASTPWHSMESVEENYLPVVVGVAVVGDRVLPCSSATARLGMSTSLLNGGRAFFRR